MAREPGFEWTIKEYEPTDAQGVAEMWNVHDPLWPDGFTAGIPFTAERIRLWHEYDKSLATFIAMAEGKAVGYCSLHAFWSAENAAYVGLFEMGVTFVLWLNALRLAPSTTRVSTLIFISPFASLVLIHFVLREPIHPATVVGLVLIVALARPMASPSGSSLGPGQPGPLKLL